MPTKRFLPEAPVKNLPTISVDESLRIIRISASGFFTASELRSHFGSLAQVVSQVRQKQWRVRVLLDLRDGIVHSPEGVALIQRKNARLYKEGDKVAILGGSALLSMQAKWVDPEHHMSFPSADQAMEWLCTE